MIWTFKNVLNSHLSNDTTEEYEKYHEEAKEQAEEKADRDRKHSSSSRNSHKNVYEMKGNFSHTNPVVQHASVDNSIL